MLTVEIVSFESFEDASGAPAIAEVRYGSVTARFALDYLGEVSCNGLGSGMSSRMVRRAADAAKRLYRAKVEALGVQWIHDNHAMYRE